MNMRIFQLGEEGGESLRQIARELTVDEIKSPKIKQLVEDMKITMRTAPGVGLAAPQIGLSIKVIVIEDNAERLQLLKPEVLRERGRVNVDFHVMFNPTLEALSVDPVNFFEGCLSVKGSFRVTPRAAKVRVKYLDEAGDPQQIEAQGWYARILQHEIDHLNGRLYIDVAHACTEVKLDDKNISHWMNASHAEIMAHYDQCYAEFKSADGE